MKTLLTIFLLINSALTLAAPVKMISEICDYDYIDGVSLEMINGRVLRVCLLKENLPDLYLTDINNLCEVGYESFDEDSEVHLCIKKSQQFADLLI